MTYDGGKPHPNVGDRGQRYEVSFFNPDTGGRMVLGWTDTLSGVNKMFEAIRVHPSWEQPAVRDRHQENLP